MPKYRISRSRLEGFSSGGYEERIIEVAAKDEPPPGAVRVADDCKADKEFVPRTEPTPAVKEG